MQPLKFCFLTDPVGFEVAVEHPHQHVVKGTQLVRGIPPHLRFPPMVPGTVNVHN